jgi:deazaflavin-dependent oxidoreductase (nitroreductase family)
MAAATILDADLAATKECRLVTVGRATGNDREVRIWFASTGDRVYLLSQDQERAHWVRNAVAEPRVRIRIDERTFEGVARVIGAMEDEDGIARDLWAEKYGTKYFGKFLREALVVAVEVEREVT